MTSNLEALRASLTASGWTATSTEPLDDAAEQIATEERWA